VTEVCRAKTGESLSGDADPSSGNPIKGCDVNNKTVRYQLGFPLEEINLKHFLFYQRTPIKQDNGGQLSRYGSTVSQKKKKKPYN